MKKDSAAYILSFIVAITAVFGTGVASVHYATRDMLARNETLLRNRVLSEVFELPVDGVTAEDYAGAVERYLVSEELVAFGGKRTFETFTTRDLPAARVGFVFIGMGFWDRITGAIVLEPSLNTIANIEFLDQKETPGLGARITETWFTDQFRGLAIDWSAADGRHVIVGPALNSDTRNRVDAITGASQTSLALMKLLNSELALFRTASRRSDR